MSLAMKAVHGVGLRDALLGKVSLQPKNKLNINIFLKKLKSFSYFNNHKKKKSKKDWFFDNFVFD